MTVTFSFSDVAKCVMFFGSDVARCGHVFFLCGMEYYVFCSDVARGDRFCYSNVSRYVMVSSSDVAILSCFPGLI